MMHPSSPLTASPLLEGASRRPVLFLLAVLLLAQTTAFQGGASFARRHDRIRSTASSSSSSMWQQPLRQRSSIALRVSLPDTEEDEDTTTATTTNKTTPPNQDKKGRQAGAATTMQLRPRSSASTTATSSSSDTYYWNYWSTGYELLQAGLVGSLTGLCVAIFKLSIELVRSITYEQDILATYPLLMALIPALGGIAVGLLLLAGGKNQAFPPGLRGTVQESDDTGNSPKSGEDGSLPTQLDFLRKSTASVATLGTGNSLGPEGPCVEIGLNVARACTGLNRPAGATAAADVDPSSSDISRRQWNRVLLSCGAAAGVAAGFNAPLAGVFFALEIMQNTFKDVDQDNAVKALQENNNSPSLPNVNMLLPPALSGSMTDSTTITPILISSVISALISQFLLGNHLILTLTDFDLATPLVELPLYLLLGALSGVVAFVFTYSAKISNQVFAGDFAPLPESAKTTIKTIPNAVKPVIGGLMCGLVGLVFPQILFFGYETLNALLKDNGELSFSLILSLMGVKTVMTAVAAGSGLVGGTFAPSLFLGGMLGCAFHEVAQTALESVMHLQVVVDNSPAMVDAVMGQGGLELDPEAMHIAGIPAYAMVGAASVLAALFRAPLTASLLLFEVTRNYDVILPLMASAGVGSIVGDILEDRFERPNEMQRRDRDPVSWGDLSFPDWKTLMEQKTGVISPNRSEDVLSDNAEDESKQ